jgi:hypothetical protein
MEWLGISPPGETHRWLTAAARSLLEQLRAAASSLSAPAYSPTRQSLNTVQTGNWHSGEEPAPAAKRLGRTPRTIEPSSAAELRFGPTALLSTRRMRKTAFNLMPNV